MASFGPPALGPQGKQPVNIGMLSQLKAQLENLGKQRRTLQTQFSEIEQKAINLLMEMGVRYIDESGGEGKGPFWVMQKAKSESGWNDDRYIEFFEKLNQEWSQGRKYTSGQMMEQAKKFIGQFQKRKIQLVKRSSVRTKNVEDLKQWLAGVAVQ